MEGQPAFAMSSKTTLSHKVMIAQRFGGSGNTKRSSDGYNAAFICIIFNYLVFWAFANACKQGA